MKVILCKLGYNYKTFKHCIEIHNVSTQMKPTTSQIVFLCHLETLYCAISYISYMLIVLILNISVRKTHHIHMYCNLRKNNYLVYGKFWIKKLQRYITTSSNWTAMALILESYISKGKNGGFIGSLCWPSVRLSRPFISKLRRCIGIVTFKRRKIPNQRN